MSSEPYDILEDVNLTDVMEIEPNFYSAHVAVENEEIGLYAGTRRIVYTDREHDDVFGIVEITEASIGTATFMFDLFVNEHCRNQGIASKLIYLANHIFGATNLECEATNTTAMRLYEKLGFKKYLTYITPEESVMYRLRLDSSKQLEVYK